MNRPAVLLNVENAVITIIGRTVVSAYLAKHQIILEKTTNACLALQQKMQISALFVNIISLVIIPASPAKPPQANWSVVSVKL